jgi:hypothetical protein
MEYKINALLKLLGVEIKECTIPDCVNGIDKASYSDQFPCSYCNGTGELLEKVSND